jgi:mono/diheme cytochrome c family protein
MKRGFLAVVAVIVLGIIACVLYAGRMVHRGFSTRAAPSTAESSLAMTMRDMAIPSRYKTMTNPIAVTPEVIQAGMAHWADHCATCHANNGGGDTMYGRTMYPRPPDMRQKDTQGMSDGELYYTIKNGIRLSGMPAFGDPGENDLDSWKLVAFIRQLPKLTEQEEMDMERLNPKSPEEMQEQIEEDQFLNGGKVSGPSKTQPMHHH